MADLFIYKWHKTEEVEPGEGDDIFFYTKGNVYAGKFDEETKMFYMADYMGYPLEEVPAWKYISNDLNYSSYPENGAHVAISTEGFDCFVTGTYDESIDYLGAVILDPIYRLVDDPEGMVLMDDIVSWTAVPEYKMDEALAKTKASFPGTAKASWAGTYDAKETPRNMNKGFPGESTASKSSGDFGKKGKKKAFPGKKHDLIVPKEPKGATNSALDKQIGSVSSDGTIGSSKKNPIKAKVGKLKTNSLGIPEYDIYTGVKFTNKRNYKK